MAVDWSSATPATTQAEFPIPSITIVTEPKPVVQAQTIITVLPQEENVMIRNIVLVFIAVFGLVSLGTLAFLRRR